MSQENKSPHQGPNESAVPIEEPGDGESVAENDGLAAFIKGLPLIQGFVDDR